MIYQDTESDGFNREDVWNILANPFTTTQPAVAIGEREQYTPVRGTVRRTISCWAT